MGQKSLTNNEGIESAIAGMKETMDEIARFYVGDPRNVKLIMGAIMASGHVLLEDFPGVGKTFLAKLTARTLGLDYNRIQFTPDLLPGDITGTKIWMPALGKFEKSMGPINSNLILADEINRAPPKTQAALLEAMEERQVTIEGETVQLPRPFIVLATQNPIEFEGTYPLPEAQVDRFLASTTVGYPSEADERRVVLDHLATGTANTAASRILDRGQLIQARTTLERIYLSEPIVDYIVALTRFTRERASVSLGASPRGSIALALLARASAAVAGRDFVAPQDVKAMATPALGHRIRLSPEAWIRGIRRESIVREAILSVPAPVGIDAD